MIRIFNTKAEAAAAVQQIETAMGIPCEYPSGFKADIYDVPKEHPDGGWYIREPNPKFALNLGGTLGPLVVETFHD